MEKDVTREGLLTLQGAALRFINRPGALFQGNFRRLNSHLTLLTKKRHHRSCDCGLMAWLFVPLATASFFFFSFLFVNRFNPHHHRLLSFLILGDRYARRGRVSLELPDILIVWEEKS